MLTAFRLGMHNTVALVLNTSCVLEPLSFPQNAFLALTAFEFATPAHVLILQMGKLRMREIKGFNLFLLFSVFTAEWEQKQD